MTTETLITEIVADVDDAVGDIVLVINTGRAASIPSTRREPAGTAVAHPSGRSLSCGPWPADGPIKNAVFAETAVRLYNFDRRAALATPDRFAEIKADYVKNGPGRSNLRYGYVRNAG